MRPLDPHPVPTHATREQRRADIGTRLLRGIEAIVRRHTVFDPGNGAGPLHAELIAAEVAHELALARNALRLAPRIVPFDDVT